MEYTAIHNEYENMIEGQIRSAMGQDKLLKLEKGMHEFLAQKREKSQSKEVFEALEILSSLGDFVVFKNLMLAKKFEMDGVTGNLGMIDSGVMNVPELMDKLQDLTQEADAGEGWTQMLDDPVAAAWAKQTEDGNTLLRVTLHVSLKPSEAFVMLHTTDAEAMAWKPMQNLQTL